MLEIFWFFGYFSIGDCIWQSVVYVVWYVLKKVNGDEVEDYYYWFDERIGEFILIVFEYVCMFCG